MPDIGAPPTARAVRQVDVRHRHLLHLRISRLNRSSVNHQPTPLQPSTDSPMSDINRSSTRVLRPPGIRTLSGPISFVQSCPRLSCSAAYLADGWRSRHIPGLYGPICDVNATKTRQLEHHRRRSTLDGSAAGGNGRQGRRLPSTPGWGRPPAGRGPAGRQFVGHRLSPPDGLTPP